MVILSEFQLIYSNKKFAKIKIRNFRKNRNCDFAIFATFAICEIAIFAISQITQFDSERGIAISQITQLDFGPILQPWWCHKHQTRSCSFLYLIPRTSLKFVFKIVIHLLYHIQFQEMTMMALLLILFLNGLLKLLMKENKSEIQFQSYMKHIVVFV